MESPRFRCVAACAEFPNDNPALYRALFEPAEQVPDAAAEAEEVREIAAEPVAEAIAVAGADSDPDTESDPDPDPDSDAVSDPQTGTDPGPPVLEADDDIEIVDDLVIENAVEEAPSLPPPPPPDDPFEALVAVLELVAGGAGASEAAMHTLYVILGRERISADATVEHSSLRTAAAAWCAILRGESEDFSTCGASTLDEWCSTVIAAALGEPARADSLRRELRRRGVAAFGLVVEAA